MIFVEQVALQSGFLEGCFFASRRQTPISNSQNVPDCLVKGLRPLNQGVLGFQDELNQSGGFI